MTETLDPRLEPATPLDHWRAARRESAVETFAAWHLGDSRPVEPFDASALGEGRTARYEALLPASPPGPGEQYRFEVDLDRCTGCKACVAACHSLNGLDEGESWRSVGLLTGGSALEPWQQHVTSACHHCADPACLSGCPVDAYEKDAFTGIVAHLDDQCIGCRYCQLTCPYEVPSFNQRLGVVRKCDLCADRLAEGEAPACVQGCPTEAISIGLVRSDALVTGPDHRIVPTAPQSSLTRPSTTYVTSREVPASVRAADDSRVVPATAHPPLAVMLVLTQLSVGAYVLTELTGLRTSGLAAWVALATAAVALGASTLHLGRPLMAWRAVIGLGHSWLSREIVAFGVYAAMLGLVAASRALAIPRAAPAVSLAAALAGVAGVACSAQVYAITGRQAWRFGPTLARFALTALMTGGATVGVVASSAVATGEIGSSEGEAVMKVAVMVVAASATAALAMVAAFLLGDRSTSGQLARTRRLLRNQLLRRVRSGAALITVGSLIAGGAVVLPLSASWTAVWWLVSLALLFGGCYVERSLFFTAAAPDRMPGALP